MFGIGRKKDVPGLLDAGRDWVAALKVASEVTREEAYELEVEATTLAAKAAVTLQVAEEGRIVAENFDKLLTARQ